MFPHEKEGKDLLRVFRAVMKERGIKRIIITENGCSWDSVSSNTSGFGFWRKLAERVRRELYKSEWEGV